MSKDFTKVPVQAMNLSESSEFKFALSDDGPEGKKKRSMSMTGYSGGVIKNHWWWGNLAIDISGMSFPKKSFPILRDHSTSMIIGHSPKPKTDDNKLQFDDVVLCDTQFTEEFVSLSDQGVPFEASIYAQPTSIERVEEDEVVDVNGYKFKGPGTIWRKSTFKECSVCVFGYDSETSSVAMSENGEVLDLSQFVAHTDKKPATSEEGNMFDVVKFQAEQPEEYKKFVEGVSADITAKFSKEIEDRDAAIAKLTAEKTAADDGAKTIEQKFADLEKKFELMQEKNIASAASSILASKLSESDLNDRVKQKLSKFIDYSKFVKEDKLDADAFSAAIDAEIKDCKEMFGTVTPAVQGGTGTQGRDLGNGADTFTEKDAEDLATKMAKGAGLIK